MLEPGTVVRQRPESEGSGGRGRGWMAGRILLRWGGSDDGLWCVYHSSSAAKTAQNYARFTQKNHLFAGHTNVRVSNKCGLVLNWVASKVNARGTSVVFLGVTERHI